MTTYCPSSSSRRSALPVLGSLSAQTTDVPLLWVFLTHSHLSKDTCPRCAKLPPALSLVHVWSCQLHAFQAPGKTRGTEGYWSPVPESPPTPARGLVTCGPVEVPLPHSSLPRTCRVGRDSVLGQMPTAVRLRPLGSILSVSPM